MSIKLPKASPWAGKVFLWPRKKMALRSISTRRSGRASTRSKGAIDHDRVRESGPEIHYELINVKKILIRKSDETLDENLVASIAESILLFDLLHPIAVRRVAEKIVLVAGAHRLEAMKRLGRKKVPCLFVQGNETDAELVRLGEDLWRKTLTVLREAEKLVKYLNLASAKVNISGQPAQKSKLGRPPGGIALAARELPLVGRSVEARRKVIDRAISISQITPEAKKVATEAGFDNNQKALLKIAKAGGRNAQLKVTAELAEIAKMLDAPAKRAANGSSSEAQAKGAATKRQTLQLDIAESTGEDTDSAAKGGVGKSEPSPRTTTFDEMIVLWNLGCRKGWAYLPALDRERFIEMIRRAVLRARVDIVEFILDVFRGRREVRKQHLFGIAAIHGFPRAAVRKTLRGLGYKSKRKGQRAEAKWFFLNPDQNWMRNVPVFSEAELAAAAAAQPNPRDHTPIQRGKPNDTDYLNDI